MYAYGHLEHLGHQERAGAHHRRHEHAPGRRRRLDRPRHLGPIARLLHQRDRERARCDGVGDGAARDHPEHAARHDGRLGGAAAITGGQRHRQVDEEAPGAEMLEQRAHDDEQHHVGDEHVGDEAEDAVGRRVAVADHLTVAEPLVREDARRQDLPEKRVDEHDHREDRQNHAHRTTARFHHQRDRDRPEHQVAGRRRAGAPRHVLVVDDEVAEGEHREHDQDEVQRAGPVARRVPRRRIAQEDEREDREQEAAAQRGRADVVDEDGEDQQQAVGRGKQLVGVLPEPRELADRPCPFGLLEKLEKARLAYSGGRRHRGSWNGEWEDARRAKRPPRGALCYFSAASGTLTLSSFQNFAAPGCSGPMLPSSGFPRFRLAPLNAMLTLLTAPSE